jgi:hypothetical protein
MEMRLQYSKETNGHEILQSAALELDILSSWLMSRPEPAQVQTVNPFCPTKITCLLTSHSSEQLI